MLSLLCCQRWKFNTISVILKAISTPFTTIHYTMYVYQVCAILSLGLVFKKSIKWIQERSSKSLFPLKIFTCLFFNWTSSKFPQHWRLGEDHVDDSTYEPSMSLRSLGHMRNSEGLKCFFPVWQSLLEWKLEHAIFFPGPKGNIYHFCCSDFLVLLKFWEEISRTATVEPGLLAGMFWCRFTRTSRLIRSTKNWNFLVSPPIWLYVLQEYLHSLKLT